MKHRCWMRSCSAAVVGMSFALTAAGTARADSVWMDFVIDGPTPDQNTLAITVGASVDTGFPFGTVSDTDTDSTTVSGNAPARLDITFDPAGNITGLDTIRFLGGRVQFDRDLALNLSFALGTATVDIDTADLAGQITTPAGPAPIAGSVFDLANHQLSITEGSLTASGGGLASGIDTRFDFNNEPLAAPLAGSATITAQLREVVAGIATYDLTLTAPFTFSDTVEIDASTSASVTAAGNLIATASFTRAITQPGDTDGDNDIDDADLGTAFANYTGANGMGKTAAQGDTDFDTDVDDADLGTLFAAYTGALTNQASPVPEPASLALLAVGALFIRRPSRSI